MKGRRWGIGSKFILFISISIVLFLAAAFLISQAVFREFALRSANELAQTILDQTDTQLAQFFRDLQFVARTLSGTRAVREVDPAAMRDLFMATVRSRDTHLRAVYLGTADGRMYEWGVGEGFVDNVPSFPPDYDPRKRPWYQLALSAGDFTVSQPYRYASVDALGITCVLPLRAAGGAAAGGAVAGVLGLDILLDDLTGILTGLRIPKEGKALLLGSSGEIIASQYPGDRGDKLALKRFDVAGGEAALQGGSGFFVGEAAGRRTLFAHRKAESFDWIIVVGMPLDTIMAPVSELLNLISAVDLLLMILFVVALATITTSLVVSPLNHMASVVDRIESGDGDARVEALSNDEFGQLGHELNKLLDAAGAYARDLEGEVHRRTEEIRRLQRDNTQLRVLEERRRIYRDMHDTIGAKLTNVFFCNGVARDLAASGPRELSAMLDRIEANCLEAISGLKEIILGMREDDRLAAEFSKRLSAGMRRRLRDGGLAFDCRIRGRESLDAVGGGARDEIEKIFEELVSNVLKHAQAARIRLRVAADAEGLSIDFSDDGRGFEPPEAGGVGAAAVSGLGNIAYRVERLGGTLRIESAPGQGTRYAIELPAVGLGRAAVPAAAATTPAAPPDGGEA